MKKSLLMLPVLLFALAALAFAESESTTSLYLKASQLEDDGDLDEAFYVYQQVLARESSPTVYMKVVDLEIKRNRIDSAFTILERAGEKYPDNAEIAFRMGAFYIEKALFYDNASATKTKWLTEAKKSFQIAADKEPTEKHLVAVAYAAAELKDYMTAMRIYDQLINNLGKTEYYRPRGVLKIEMGKRKEGIEDIKKAAATGEDPQALIRLADLAREDNDTKGAIAYLQKALEISPDMAVVNLYLGELYKDQKDYENAIRFYMQAAEHTDGKMRAALLKQVGGLALEKEDYLTAIDAYRMALKDNPNDAQLYYMAGYAASRGGLREEAQRIFDAGLGKFPDYAVLRKRSAFNLIMMGKPKEAAAVVEKIDEVERDLEYYLVLSNAYAEIPDRAKAIATLNKGIAENPGSLELYMALAVQYEEEKKYEDCITVLKKALEINPGSASAQNFLGYLYADLNRNLDEAEVLLNKALAKEPGNYAYMDSKAWLLFRKGRYQEAYELMQKALEVKPDDPEMLEHMEQIRKKLPSGRSGT